MMANLTLGRTRGVGWMPTPLPFSAIFEQKMGARSAIHVLAWMFYLRHLQFSMLRKENRKKPDLFVALFFGVEKVF